MRNLVLLNRGQIHPQPLTCTDLRAVDAVFDAVADTVTVVLSSEESQVVEVHQYTKSGDVQVLAAFPAPAARLVSFAHFADAALAALVFANGDLICAHYDAARPDIDTTRVELVGLVDAGVQAAGWAPDEETLAVVTAQRSVLLLSRLFEPVAERPLDPADVRVTDAAHVSVGWGAAETQFRGKGARALEREREAIRHAGGHDLKEDAALRDPTVAPAQRGTASPADSGAATVSWRGDGEYVAVSTLEDALVEATLERVARRVVRVFTREGALHSVLEPADGVEHALAWRPSGAVLALTQRGHDDDGTPVLQVAFFERNGLRHGEFDTRLDAAAGRVAGLAWACNSEVLALQLADRVQLWTSKNYHWYLKQELVVSGADARNEVVFVRFHPEKPLHLMVGTSRAGLWVYNLAQQTATGPTVAGRDAGMVVVIDGAEAKVTPLALANVPPPMAYRDYDFDAPLCAAAVNRANDAFAVATCAGDVHVCRVSPADMRRGVQPAVATIGRALIAAPDEVVKQVCFIADTTVAVLVDAPGASRVELFDVHATATHVASAELGGRAVLLKARADFAAAVAECIDGSLLEVLAAGATARVAQFPVLCNDFEVCMVSGDMGEEPVALGVSGNGKLYGNDMHLASGVTSIKATQDHLVLTNAHSQVCFVHLKNVLEPATFSFLQNQTAAAADERVRQIERGLVLVSCIPSKYSVVLQAPRGNLETICPRIMVLSGVRNFIAALDYRNAFVACRTHRIDLDLLHDYDPALFHSNVELFVKQIGRADYLDLFVSCLHEEDVTQTKYRDTLRQAPLLDLAKLSLEPRNAEPASASPRRMTFNKEDARASSKINRICNAVLEVLSAPPYESQFLQTRVTAYACQAPPNLPGALSLISALEDEDEHEKAITHLCFLLDVNKLYDHALELYDVKMALNIAQKSQKDPKEYLPFLQNLHVQTPLRRQFLIDDHLKHYSKALGWLHELGHEAVAELDDFVVKHSLYKDALAIYRYDDQRNKHILALYAEHLVEEKKYGESGVIYEYLGSLEQALESFVLCMRWKEALAIAQSLPGKELVISTAERLSSMLVDDHKYSDAAEIELRVLGNVEEAVKLHCKSYQFDSAILLATEKNHTDLIASTVDLQLDESFGVIAELLADCTSQANSQLKRFRELRQKKEDDPYAFYGIPNDDLDTPDNVSVAASETSTTPSFFTKYTGKTSGTAKTGASRKTSKNRKREERKRAKGRKGTIYEEEYLIKSVGRLVERLDQTEADALRLIEGLVRRHKMQQAYQIQHNWGKLTVFLRENIQEIHNMSEKDRERIDDNGEIYLIDEIPAPAIRDFPKLEMLDY